MHGQRGETIALVRARQSGYIGAVRALIVGSMCLLGCSSPGTSGAPSSSAVAPSARSAPPVASSSVAADASAAPTAKALVLPKVTLDGVELPVKDAVIYGSGAKSLTVTISTERIDCTPGGVIEGKASEKRVDLTLGRTFGTGGRDEGYWVSRFMTYGDRGPGHMRLPPDRSNPIEVQRADPDGLDATLQLVTHDTLPNASPKVVSVTGPIVARGCGVIAGLRDAKDRPQTKLKATVIGDEIEIHAARIEPYPSGRRLVLSTEPVPCEYTPFPNQDVGLGVIIEGTPPKIGAIWVEGDRFRPDDSSLISSFREASITVGEAKDGVVPIEIDANGGGIGLHGHVDALDCPK
ncbi:MAG: hypothetical protein U0414_20095 [Polyangiaceae bacterium]